MLTSSHLLNPGRVPPVTADRAVGCRWRRLMTPERWERIKQLYHNAGARRPGERLAFLAESCAGDEDLRLQVQALLDQPVSTRGFVDFLGGPVSVLAARLGDEPGASLLIGRRLGDYQMQALLGRGGMGDVY